MIRIDAMWLAVDPVDMRAGAERLLASVVQVFGAAQAHHGYLFANARATRVKLLVHDGFGLWCAARRLNEGRFAWPVPGSSAPPALTQAQFDALVVGLPCSAFSRCSSSRARSRDRCELHLARDQLAHAPMTSGCSSRTMGDMLDVQALKPGDLDRLAPAEKDALLLQMLSHIGHQSKALQDHQEQIQERDKALKFKDARIEKITFELQRLKRWQFGAHSERMTADQRQLFEETLVEDQESLQAELDALLGEKADKGSRERERRAPKREALPAHLRREEHRHEPQDTTCACGQPMVRIGEDVSERLDIVPAEFFVHRHIRGKWTCKCCQTLVQEPTDPQIIDGGIPTAALLAHLLVSRYVDHLPYYRIEKINARSGVRTPRSTLAAWSGRAGAALTPLYEALRRFALSCPVLHVDESPVSLLDPGAGKTRKAYVWGYARSVFDAQPCVVYEFCAGRAAKYPTEFLKGWNGTIVCDDYKAYASVAKIGVRAEAGCAAHARCKFEELDSPVGVEGIRRFERIYRIERAIMHLSSERRSK